MKAEDTEIRIKAMQKLKIVAGALGAERTRAELIPMLMREYAVLSERPPAVFYNDEKAYMRYARLCHSYSCRARRG